MRILVTGAAGLIGSELVRQLDAGGHGVMALDIRPLAASLAHHQCDIRDAAELKRICAAFRPDLTFHLAALSTIPDCEVDPSVAWETNVEGALNVARAIGPSRLVFASSAAVYAPSCRPNEEDDRLGPIDTYGRTKLEAERRLQEAQGAIGFDLALVRLFNVVGGRDHRRRLVPDVLGQMSAGSSRIEVGNLSPIRDFIDIEEAAQGLAKIAEAQRQGAHPVVILNLGSGKGHSVAEVVEIARELSGSTATIVANPVRRRAHDRSHLVASTARLRAATGWVPQLTLRQIILRAWAEVRSPD